MRGKPRARDITRMVFIRILAGVCCLLRCSLPRGRSSLLPGEPAAAPGETVLKSSYVNVLIFPRLNARGRDEVREMDVKKLPNVHVRDVSVSSTSTFRAERKEHHDEVDCC